MDINLKKTISNPNVIAVIAVVVSLIIFLAVKQLGFVKQMSVSGYLKSESFMKELAEITDELRRYDPEEAKEKQDKSAQYTNELYGLEKEAYVEPEHEKFKWLQYYVTTRGHSYHNKVMSKFFDNGVGFYCQIDQMNSESVFYLRVSYDKDKLVQLESSNLNDQILSSYLKKLMQLIEQDEAANGKMIDEFEVYFFVPKGVPLQDVQIIQEQRQVNLFIFLLIQTVAVILYVVGVLLINKFVRNEEVKKPRIPFIIRLAGYIGGVLLVRWLLINAYEQGMPWELIIERGTGLLFYGIIMIAFLSCIGYELRHLVYKFEGTLTVEENEESSDKRGNVGKKVYEHLCTSSRKIYDHLRINLNYNCWIKVAEINIIHFIVVGVSILIMKFGDVTAAVVIISVWCAIVGILLKSVVEEWEQFIEEFSQNQLIKQYSDKVEKINEYTTLTWELFVGYCVIFLVGVIACACEGVERIGYIMVIALIVAVLVGSWKIVDTIWNIYEYTEQILQHDKSEEKNIGLFRPIIGALERAEESFNEAVQREVASERMKTELISNVSHDLKTPLTAIISYIDLLKREDLSPEEQRKYIEILDQKSQRLKILIEDLFEASKAASGNIQFTMEEIDLVALLKQTLGEMSEKVGRSHLQFKVTVPEKKLMSCLDGRRTYRIFENLINNILKYAAPYSRVYIECKEEEENNSIIFRNISEKEMNFTAEEIVERFKRGDASRHTEGSGLGLAIAKNLTELQRGVFEVYIDGDLFKVSVKFPKVQRQEKRQNTYVNQSQEEKQEEYDEYGLEESQEEGTQGIGKIIKKHIKHVIEEIQNEQEKQKEENEEEDEDIDLNDYFGKDIDEK